MCCMNRRSRQQRDLTSDRASNQVHVLFLPSDSILKKTSIFPKGLGYRMEVVFENMGDRGNSNSQRLILRTLSPTPPSMSQLFLSAASECRSIGFEIWSECACPLPWPCLTFPLSFAISIGLCSASTLGLRPRSRLSSSQLFLE